MLYFKLRENSKSELNSWLNKGDQAWQLTAGTLVALQSIPGLAILYAGFVKKYIQRQPTF